MKIRRARPADFRRLSSIDPFTGQGKVRGPWLRQSIRERSVWVQLRSGEIQAYAILAPTFFQHPFIGQLFVAEEARRQGLGESLLAELEKLCVHHGEIWTSTNRSNQRMHRLLKKRGFLHRGRITGLDKDDAEVFYSKRLSRRKPAGA